jgi:hypothetical protein
VRFDGFLASESSQSVQKTGSGRRQQYDKVGKYRYLLQKLDTTNRELRQIKTFMRYLAKGLEHSMAFESTYIQDIACRDEKDREILEELRGAGEYGMLPRDVAARLGDKSYTRFYVTARLKQMNKKLDAVLGQRVAEKRGKNWALTSFMRESWDSTKEELLVNVQRD